MFMHDTGTTIEARIKEHESIQRGHCDACCFEIIKI